MSMFRYTTGALVVTGMMLNSCATIISGSHQEINIKTDRQDAHVIVDGHYQGKGNQAVKLTRDEVHIIDVVPVKGEPLSKNLEKSLSPVILFNLLIPVGTTVGAIVDFITGACYKFDEEEVEFLFDSPAPPSPSQQN